MTGPPVGEGRHFFYPSFDGAHRVRCVAYDEDLAERVRGIIGEDPRLREQKMFGGIAFLIDGNMCVGIVDNDLMVRVGPAAYDDALAHPHAREMDFTGRPMRGIVYVDVNGTATDVNLDAWIDRGLEFVGSLPPKQRRRPGSR